MRATSDGIYIISIIFATDAKAVSKQATTTTATTMTTTATTASTTMTIMFAIWKLQFAHFGAKCL